MTSKKVDPAIKEVYRKSGDMYRFSVAYLIKRGYSIKKIKDDELFANLGYDWYAKDHDITIILKRTMYVSQLMAGFDYRVVNGFTKNKSITDKEKKPIPHKYLVFILKQEPEDIPLVGETSFFKEFEKYENLFKIIYDEEKFHSEFRRVMKTILNKEKQIRHMQKTLEDFV